MSLKRLNFKELMDTCTEIFFTQVGKYGSYCLFNNELVSNETKTPLHFVRKSYENELEMNSQKLKMFQEVLENNPESSVIRTFIEALGEERELIKFCNMHTQKQYYEATGKIDYCRSYVTIPLNKLINSFYDDFYLEVLFYDDIATLRGKFEEYCNIKDNTERINFIRSNIEITHIGLSLRSHQSYNPSLLIMMKGDYQGDTCFDMKVLKKEFSDFSKLKLADINTIENNDIRQILQSKIDLDKENLTLKAGHNVRGSLYQIYEDPTNSNNYIRYICPSTGRIYFNLLNHSALSTSKYYKKGDYESYIDAWWNVAHLGASVDGKNVVSC